MDSIHKSSHLTVDVPLGWHNIHASRRRNAVGHIFLDQALLGGTPLRTAFVANYPDNPRVSSNESEDSENSAPCADDSNEDQALHFWKQVVRRGRRNGEWNIFLSLK